MPETNKTRHEVAASAGLVVGNFDNQPVPALSPNFNPADRPIAEINKNSRERINVALQTYKGNRTCSLRLFAMSTDGKLVPTKTGISIKPALLAAVIGALQKARAAAIEEGLIDG